MSTFILSISCLTTSNIPWFMNVIPRSYAILLFTASALASITSHIHNWILFLLWFHPSFFLGLFLHWSPVAYWALTNLGSSSFSILSFCLSYAEYIMQNAGLNEAQAGIKIAGRNINNLRYADDTMLMAESEELKSLLRKMKEESEKAGLKLNIQKTKIMVSGPTTSWQLGGGKMWTVTDFIFLGSKITADGDYSHEMKRHMLPCNKSYDKPRQCIKKQRDHFADKGPYSQGYGSSRSHVWMRELDHKQGWVLKNWCFWIVVLEKTLESLLERKEIKPVNPKGNQSWIFIGRSNAEAPIIWPPNTKCWLTGKDPDGSKDWGQEEKGATEEETVGWHHWHQWTWICANSGR